VKTRTHLFVAAQTAFGEAVLGLGIARELHARGDRIVVLAGDALSVLTERTPFTTIALTREQYRSDVAGTIRKIASDVHAASIVLLDATLVYRAFKAQGSDATFVRDAGTTVIGLDVWNTRESGLSWDLCGTTLEHTKRSLDVTRRLVPVPFARPTGLPGLYNALPPALARGEDEREEIRADLGLGRADRLLLLTSARWQDPTLQAHESGRRTAATLPLLAGELIGRLGKSVRVVHVGPAPYEMPSLGSRYTWLAPRTPPRFAKILAAADLLVSWNFSATTIVSAIAAGLPVVLGINSYEGNAAEVTARLPEPPSPALRAWLAKASPLPAFRVWPLGLHKFLAPAAKANPYTEAMRTVEFLEEGSAVDAMRSLLFDEAARAALREAQAGYGRVVAKLPSAADLVDAYLES